MSNTIVSVSRGAELVRKDRQTLYNHRKQGKLSFVKRHDDSYGVDTAELQRVYGKLYVTEAEISSSRTVGGDSTATTAITELRHQLEIKELELEYEKKDTARLREKIDAAESVIKQIEDKRSDKAKLDAEVELKWKQALSDRQDEVNQARQEAAEIRQREQEQAAALQAETARVVALESRGLIDRLLNRKVKLAEELT